MFARRLLCAHSSPVTGRPLRGLLPIPYRPVSEVWEPVDDIEDSIRLRALHASSDLRVWLLLLLLLLLLFVTGLHWLHCSGIGPRVPLVCRGPPSKAQVMDLSLLTGEVKCFGSRSCKLAPLVSTKKKTYTTERLNLKRTCAQPRAEDQRPRRRRAPRSNNLDVGCELA